MRLEGVEPRKTIEADNVPEFFISGVADLTISGGIFRLALCSERASLQVVRVRLAIPLDRARAINQQVGKLMTECSPWN